MAIAQIWLAALLLLCAGLYVLRESWRTQVWQWAWVAIPLIAAAVGTATRRNWAKPLVYILATLYIGVWLYEVWNAFRAGVFNDRPALMNALSLVPGLGLVVLPAAYCCYVVSAYLRALPKQI